MTYKILDCHFPPLIIQNARLNLNTTYSPTLILLLEKRREFMYVSIRIERTYHLTFEEYAFINRDYNSAGLSLSEIDAEEPYICWAIGKKIFFRLFYEFYKTLG